MNHLSTRSRKPGGKPGEDEAGHLPFGILLPEALLDFQPRHQTDQIEWQGLTPVAAWLIALARPRRFVELGTHMGDSYCAFCQAIAEQNVECEAYAVDSWDGDEHTGRYGPAVYSGLKDYHDPLYSAFSRLMRTTFDEAAPSFEDSSIDLLHIDGLHTYEAVRHDFETWLPKVSKSGVIVIHDTRVRERGFGVYRYWAELEREYLCFEFPFSNGLGVVIPYPESSPETLVRVARATEEQRHPLILILNALGNTVVMRAKARWQAEEAERLKARNNELGWAIGDLRERHRSELNDLLQSVIGEFPRYTERLEAIERRLDAIEGGVNDETRHDAPAVGGEQAEPV